MGGFPPGSFRVKKISKFHVTAIPNVPVLQCTNRDGSPQDLYIVQWLCLYPMSSQERCRSMLYVLIINRVRLNHHQEYVCTTSSPSKIKVNQDTRNTHSLLISVIIFSQSLIIIFLNLIFVVHISFSSCRLPAPLLNAITKDPSKLFLCFSWAGL